MTYIETFTGVIDASQDSAAQKAQELANNWLEGGLGCEIITMSTDATVATNKSEGSAATWLFSYTISISFRET